MALFCCAGFPSSIPIDCLYTPFVASFNVIVGVGVADGDDDTIVAWLSIALEQSELSCLSLPSRLTTVTITMLLYFYFIFGLTWVFFFGFLERDAMRCENCSLGRWDALVSCPHKQVTCPIGSKGQWNEYLNHLDFSISRPFTSVCPQL